METRALSSLSPISIFKNVGRSIQYNCPNITTLSPTSPVTVLLRLGALADAHVQGYILLGNVTDSLPLHARLTRGIRGKLSML